MDGSTSWPRIARLPLTIETYELEGLGPAEGLRMERVTTHIRLLGDGRDGLGEDISPLPEEHEALRAAGAALPLAGRWTLESFCDHLAGLELWAAPPRWDAARLWRRWAFESAALDLALRQADTTLAEALGLQAQPVRFVNSLGLGDPPSAATIHDRIARLPGVRFKLDAEPRWTAELLAELAATDAVDTIDFKGHYGLEVEDQAALVALYDRVLEAFPAAILEDPHDVPEVAERLAAVVDRVSYDAPVHAAADLATTPLRVSIVNVKPCRFGGLRPLLEFYAHAAEHGLQLYGGGMGELGAGRVQIQTLASLFHPDAPNDVAPSAYNALRPADGLPASPLPVPPRTPGFGRLPTQS